MSKINSILVISDIHGNKEALQVVEKTMKKHSIDKVICLGDVVGYGVDFEWCLNWLNEKNAVILRGNHESMMIQETSTDKCSSLGKKSCEWTKQRLSEKDLNTFSKMPYTYEYKDILFTHAGNNEILQWKYINDIKYATSAFVNSRNINFYGHTHRPCIIEQDGTVVVLEKSCNLEIQSSKRYYINPGSVGQNRGRLTRASFIILDKYDDKYVINYYNIGYKSYRTYRKMLDNQMPEEIGSYLIREEWRKRLYSIIYRLLNSRNLRQNKGE